MEQLTIIEHNGSRVLTTSLLAEGYGADKKQIYDNFANNKDRYVEGKHYYCLRDEALKAFKEAPENAGLVSDNTPVLYLWTEKGALLHAKSLNTDKAWEVYDRLVEEYFRMSAIRVRDSYMIADPVERAQRWIEEYQEKQALTMKVEEQKVQIEEQQETIVEQQDAIEVMSPKAAYCDIIIASPGLMSVSEIAKDYGMTANKFNKKLCELGIQYNVSGVWTLFSQYEKKGYTKIKPVTGGNGKAKDRAYWTHKGRLFLYEKLKENGILPEVER